MEYSEILKSLIGIPTLNSVIDNPFPIIGDSVTITSNSKWAKKHNYIIDNGLEKQNITKDCVLGESEQTIVPQKQGEFVQNINVQNSSGEYSVNKTIYPMDHPTEPYFNIEATEIIRVGETGKIQVISDNGYQMTRPHNITVRIYKENEESNPVKTIKCGTDSFDYCTFVFSEISDRGIYDVEVDVTDISTEVMLSKRINKLITVTPALANKEDAIVYLMPDAKKVGGSQTWIWDGSNVPAGSTVILKYDPKYGEKYPMRFRMVNFNGTWEKPIIITIDTEEPFEWNWYYWFGWYMDNCHHIVVDGRGYNNLTKGIKLIAMPEFANICIQIGELSDEIEIFEVDIHKADFAGVMCKTDPDVNKPETWWDNFKFNRFLFHHCYVHDTTGEGNYLGHYASGWYEGQNSEGELVKYRAHHLYNCRIYRNIYENQGYDNFQLNNAENAEICYNYFINGGYRLEVDQTGSMAIGISGKIYNNVIYNSQGPGIQLGWLGPLEFFNNLILQGGPSSSAIYNLAHAEPPAQDGSFVHNTFPFIIHNNLLMSYSGILLGRTTNYTDNIQMYDNICIYKSILYGGQYAESIAKWVIKNNYEKKIISRPYNYGELDSELKFGDSEHLDYRIAATSPVVEGGCGDSFKFDFNGYKNWYTKVFPIGPYLGKYRDPSVIDADFALGYILINNGDSSTKSSTVQVTMKYKGNITHYKLSENSDLEQEQWIEYQSDTVSYTFSHTGQKTLYCQIKNQDQVSEIKSSSIIYLDSPLELVSIMIGDGSSSKYGTSIVVHANYRGSVAPSYYMIWDGNNQDTASWQPFTSAEIPYSFDSIGPKTVYLQLKDNMEQLTDIKSASITILEPRSAVISVGWTNSEIGENSQFDNVNQISKIVINPNGSNFYWSVEQQAGKVFKNDSYGGLESSQTNGYITGDDSGIYPDNIIKHNARFNGNPTNGYGYRSVIIALSPGNYKLSLYMAYNSGNKDGSKFMKVQTVVDGVVDDFVIPEGYSYIDNSSTWLEKNITITELGQFELRWGIENSNIGWVAVPLNIIRIEEI